MWHRPVAPFLELWAQVGDGGRNQWRARGHRGPACAHIDTAAVRAALRRHIEADPAIAVIDRLLPADVRLGWIDASGRRAITAPGHRRPPRTWTAATVTVQSRPETAADLQLAAAPDGYAYRLGSAHWTTIGWVGPHRALRDAADLRDRIEHAGAGGPAVPIGDAALTRDAVARHLRHLSTMAAACRYAHSPAWARYGAWITELAESHGTKC